MIKLERKIASRNPLVFNNIEISEIIFYNENGILYKRSLGWLNNQTIEEKKKDIFEHIPSLSLKSLVEANTENLTLKENYCIYNYNKSFKKESYSLFIYVDNENVTLNKVKEEVYEKENELEIRQFDLKEYVITGIYEKDIHVVASKHINTFCTPLYKKALALENENRYNDNLCNLDIEDWVELIKKYNIKPCNN